MGLTNDKLSSNIMIEYQHHELSGLPKIYRTIALKIYPNKKWLISSIFVFFSLACASLLIKEKTVHIPVLNSFPIIFVLIAVWATFLVVLCSNFYPNQTYTDDNYVLSSYEMAGDNMKKHTILFSSFFIVTNSVLSLALLISVLKDIINFIK